MALSLYTAANRPTQSANVDLKSRFKTVLVKLKTPRPRACETLHNTREVGPTYALSLYTAALQAPIASARGEQGRSQEGKKSRDLLCLLLGEREQPQLGKGVDCPALNTKFSS